MISLDPLAQAAAEAQARLAAIHQAAEEAGHVPDSDAWGRFVDNALRRDLEERNREAQKKRVKELANEMWEKAKPATPEHGYLKRKGVTDATGLKVWGKDRLLIPMKAVGGSEIVNLQRIWPDGKKRYLKGGDTKGLRTTIGVNAFAVSNLLYITEGWCTGWSISAATGSTVVVAFSADQLLHVAVAMRKHHPDARIIIAADNDRWSVNGETPNPGVTRARAAAEACSGLVVIPDFADLTTRPTDFNDLLLLEGEDRVRYWLDPAHADEARTLAEPAPSTNGKKRGRKPNSEAPPVPEPPPYDGPEVEPPQADETEPPPDDERRPVTWLDRAPFRCLGHNHSTYYYLPRGTGQITALTPGQHDRKTLNPLAPLSYWEQHFPAKNGVSWTAAADALFHASHRAGVFRPERIRGRGCWPEKGSDGKQGILIHLGDRLVPPGGKKFVDPEEYRSPTRFIYERQHRLAGPSMDPLELTEAEAILDVFRSFHWLDSASASLAAGWTVLAPVCGALSWRPHVFIVGERGCGKSTFLTRVVVPLLGDMVLEVQGQTTEAGVRQELGADALAVVFDEAEEDETARNRIQHVLALARQASTESGARTLKGTVQGDALQFRMRSMFCLASIGGAVHTEADRSRVSLLQLRGASQVGRDERLEHWRRLAPKLEAISPELGERLIARTLRLLRSGMLMESVRVFRLAAATVLGEARPGDQYGTLYAGAWTLMSDEPPSEEEAREIIASEDLKTYEQDHVPEGRKALGVLLQQVERLDTPNGPKSLAVGQLVDICCGQAGEVEADLADARLRQIGIRVKWEGDAWVVYFSNNSVWMRHALRDTQYARGVRTVLLTLPGVVPGDQLRFHAGLKTRTIKVPYSVLV